MCDKPENVITDVIRIIGDDPERDGLKGTPNRVLRAWGNELFTGYKWKHEEIKKMLSVTFTETNEYDQMILCGPIEFTSFCEHHILPFVGECYVGYIPNGRVVGLSKIPRLVDIFARRLQIQERLTQEIADTFNGCVKPLGVGVLIKAKHLCMGCRGAKQPGAAMLTSALGGVFLDKISVKDEFLTLVGMNQ